MADEKMNGRKHRLPKPTAPRKGRAVVAAAKPTIADVCVYCGSGKGSNPAYAAAANDLGKALAAAGIGLVYGGGGLGLMGEVARSVLGNGGRVTGIIPSFLSEKEQMLQDVTQLIVTADMHERKRMMFERSDAFVALPGGIGTLEELVEQLTWAQLGRHAKPIVLVDVDGFWSPLLALLEHMRAEEFIRKGLEVRFHVVSDARKVVSTLRKAAAAAPATDSALTAKL
jgi:uncharacterized protein (TIGR00730 family)